MGPNSKTPSVRFDVLQRDEQVNRTEVFRVTSRRGWRPRPVMLRAEAHRQLPGAASGCQTSTDSSTLINHAHFEGSDPSAQVATGNLPSGCDPL